MRELAAVVPVVPVLAKADTMTAEELKVAGGWGGASAADANAAGIFIMPLQQRCGCRWASYCMIRVSTASVQACLLASLIAPQSC
jgi:hypothetical protein